MTEPDVYEERYAWNRRTKSVVIGGVVAVAASIGVAMPRPGSPWAALS